jgi:hypothetical protein
MLLDERLETVVGSVLQADARLEGSVIRQYSFMASTVGKSFVDLLFLRNKAHAFLVKRVNWCLDYLRRFVQDDQASSLN